MVRAHALQHVRLGGVAVIDRLPARAAVAGARHVEVERHIGVLEVAQHLRHRLPHAAIAGDDHMALQPARLVARRLDGLAARAVVQLAFDERAEIRQERRHRHGDGGDDQHVLAHRLGNDVRAHRRGDTDKGEFTARRQQQAGAQRGGQRQRERLHQRRQDEEFEHDQANDADRHIDPGLRQHAEIDLHADGNEEQAQEQPLERLDIRLDLVAELGLRQQQPRKERAQRHGQPGKPGEPRRAQHRQQRQRHEQFRALGPRHHAVEMPHQPAPGDDDDHHRQHCPQQRRAHKLGDMAGFPGGKDRHQHQQRHHGQVLRQQDGKARTAHARGEFTALHQKLHHHRRGGQRQAQPDDDRRLHRIAPPQGHSADDRAGDDHLREAEAEHHGPHRLKALDRKLKPDHEQEEDDTQLGHARHAVNVVDNGKAERADDGADKQIAEHRARLEPAEQRHQQHARHQEDQHLADIGHRGVARGPVAVLAHTRSTRRHVGSLPCNFRDCIRFQETPLLASVTPMPPAPQTRSWDSPQALHQPIGRQLLCNGQAAHIYQRNSGRIRRGAVFTAEKCQSHAAGHTRTASGRTRGVPIRRQRPQAAAHTACGVRVRMGQQPSLP